MTDAPSAFDSAGLQYVWDSTSLALADACWRKYQYKMLEGWQPRRKSEDLTFGQHYATALELYTKLCASGASLDDALILTIQDALIATWEHEEDEEGRPIEGTGGPWESTHTSKTRENLIRTIVWYVDHWKDDPAPVHILPDGKPAVEYTFKLPVDGGIIFAGHIDRLVDYSGGQYVMDQKTTASTIASYYFDRYSNDIQFSMYTFAAKAIYSIPVSGVIIDAAQVMVGFSRFERGMVFRTQGSLDEWYAEMLDLTAEARKRTAQHLDGNKWAMPQRRASCNNYGGCEFRFICSQAPEMREAFLNADFVKGERWNPARTR